METKNLKYFALEKTKTARAIYVMYCIDTTSCGVSERETNSLPKEEGLLVS
jgi:hypothetical protein